MGAAPTTPATGPCPRPLSIPLDLGDKRNLFFYIVKKQDAKGMGTSISNSYHNVIVTIITFLMLIGCANVSYLPFDSSVTFPSTGSIKVFSDKPEVPYIELGLITAESGDISEEGLFDLLKKKAMSIGAHAIIMKLSNQQTGTVGIPSYGGTLMVPVTSHRLEAIAIRFQESSGSNEK